MVPRRGGPQFIFVLKINLVWVLQIRSTSFTLLYGTKILTLRQYSLEQNFGSGKGEIIRARRVLTGTPEYTSLVFAHRIHHCMEKRAALPS